MSPDNILKLLKEKKSGFWNYIKYQEPVLYNDQDPN